MLPPHKRAPSIHMLEKSQALVGEEGPKNRGTAARARDNKGKTQKEISSSGRAREISMGCEKRRTELGDARKTAGQCTTAAAQNLKQA